MATTAPIVANGVNVTQLVDTVGLIKADPSLAHFRFRTTTDWRSGGASRTRIESYYGAGQERAHEHAFELAGDEPPILLGGDTAPNAVEAVLHALASCIAVGMAYNAAARGIEIEKLSFVAEGDLDLHGFLGLSENVRAGFERITFTTKVKAKASRSQLEELCTYVQRTSPVLDILRNPVPVTIELET